MYSSNLPDERLYFGRTLDYEFSYGEEIAVTPRNYPFHFRHTENLEKHYAIIGMAHMAGDYPLYYDAVNEKGVGMAGLNFVGNAYYHKEESGKKMWHPLNLFHGCLRSAQR